MTRDESLKLENQLCFSIYAASRAITKIYRPFLEELGITYPQYIVMLVLWEKKVITLKELCNKLYLDSGTLTPLLKRLEKIELITRERSSEDERVLFVSVTDKGMDLKNQAMKIPECIIRSLNSDMELISTIKTNVDKLLGTIVSY